MPTAKRHLREIHKNVANGILWPGQWLGARVPPHERALWTYVAAYAGEEILDLAQLWALGKEEKFAWYPPKRDRTDQLASIRSNSKGHFVDLDTLLAGHNHTGRFDCFMWGTPDDKSYQLTFQDAFPRIRIHIPPNTELWNKWPLLNAWVSLSSKKTAK